MSQPNHKYIVLMDLFIQFFKFNFLEFHIIHFKFIVVVVKIWVIPLLNFLKLAYVKIKSHVATSF